MLSRQFGPNKTCSLSLIVKVPTFELSLGATYKENVPIINLFMILSGLFQWLRYGLHFTLVFLFLKLGIEIIWIDRDIIFFVFSDLMLIPNAKSPCQSNLFGISLDCSTLVTLIYLLIDKR